MLGFQSFSRSNPNAASYADFCWENKLEVALATARRIHSKKHLRCKTFKKPLTNENSISKRCKACRITVSKRMKGGLKKWPSRVRCGSFKWDLQAIVKPIAAQNPTKRMLWHAYCISCWSLSSLTKTQWYDKTSHPCQDYHFSWLYKPLLQSWFSFTSFFVLFHVEGYVQTLNPYCHEMKRSLLPPNSTLEQL